ncbi:MAG: glycosyltransferase [Acidobacteriota bacterium]
MKNRNIDNSKGQLPIMLFTETLTIGGTEQQMMELAKRLDNNRYKIVLGCKLASGPLLKEVTSAQIPLIEFPLRSFREPHALYQLSRLVKFLYRHRIQVLHTTGNMGNTFVALAGMLASVPVIITSRRDLGDLTPAALKLVQRIIAKKSSGILVNAVRIKTQLIDEEDVAPEKIHVIANGIDLSRFVITPSQTTKILCEFDLYRYSPLIGVVANLKPIKGIQFFLPAFRELLRYFPNAHALIVGTSFPGWEEELRRQCDQLGIGAHITFTGYRADIPALLSVISLFVLPSLSEGLPNALMEAMASGVPAVATAVGGTLELIKPEETGLLVPPGDSEQLAAAMLRIVSQPNLGAKLSSAARRFIAHYDINRMVQATENLYEQLLGRADWQATQTSMDNLTAN